MLDGLQAATQMPLHPGLLQCLLQGLRRTSHGTRQIRGQKTSQCLRCDIDDLHCMTGDGQIIGEFATNQATAEDGHARWCSTARQCIAKCPVVLKIVHRANVIGRIAGDR